MGQIIVQKPGGNTINLFQRNPLRTVTAATQSQKLLSEDVVNLTIESVEPIDVGIGDTILVFGTVYTLNQLPVATKNADRRFVYEVTFEGPQYSLLRGIYLNQDVSGFATGAEFSLTGDVEMFAKVLITNLDRVLRPVWILGDFPKNTPTKTLSFNGENTLSVLQKICTEFETEFEIVSVGAKYQINFKKLGQLLGHTFAYGRGRGLYQLSRQTVTSDLFVTRLYAYGGNKNIPGNYRGYSPRLRLDNGLSFIESQRAKQAFGLIEGTKVWEDIYPHRIGKISGVGVVTAGVKTFDVVDGTMDFGLADESGPPITVNGKPQKQYKYILPGVSAKLHFNSGGLAGYEFEISGYDHTTKTFTLIVIQDERGLNIPNADSTAFQAQTGDEYVLLDIQMPQTYVDKAESDLLKTATDYLDAHSAPRVQYSLSVDEQYLQAGAGDVIPNFFTLGDYLGIDDSDLNVTGASRIIGFTRDVLYPFRYQVEIADTYEITLVERILSQQAAVNTIVRLNNLSDPARARYGWRTTQELLNLVFDTDDYFDGTNIKPESIETSMIVVGAKSQQFILNCVIEPNFQGQVNVVKVNTGSLTHYTVEETIKTWTILSQTITIPDDSPRYIYARCSKTATADGGLLFSGEQIKPNDNAQYYHFLVGVLHQKDAGLNIRWISLTYGATAINGRFIKTGRIQSFDGLTYFDLDAGEIGGKITFLTTDGQIRPIGELTQTTIDGGVITSGSIELAGADANGNVGPVKAGITGAGTADNSVRIWAGATKAKRATAPFRVLQNGEVYARRRIELTNEQNVGQAGIAGSNTTADGTVRFWAGKPYAERNTAPYRVLADGSMVATAGLIGHWVISGDGILNEDGSAYIIARSSTNIHRTEARIGAQVFPATFGGKGAAQFVATETDPFAPNFAAVFQAANGSENYAIYAQTGISQLGEALINGRAYYGQAITNVTLLIDPSLYDVIEIFPSGSSAALRFITPTKPLKNGKTMIVINSNDQFNNFFLSNMIRGNASFQMNGGTALTLVYTNGFWYGLSNFDNTFGSSTAPFIPEPANAVPVRVLPIPNVTITSRETTNFNLSSGYFSDPGDTLSWYASGLPNGVTFSGGNQQFSLTPDAQNGVYTIGIQVTDSKNQSATGSFVLTLNRPPLNAAPLVGTAIPDQTVTVSGLWEYVIPLTAFLDPGDLLSYELNLQGVTGLPRGMEFDPDTRTVSAIGSVANSAYSLTITATDTAGQAISQTFSVTLNRVVVNPVTPPVVPPANPETYVEISNEGYTPPVGTTPPDSGDGRVPTPFAGETTYMVANPSILNPIVEWDTSTPKRARIRNTVTPAVPSGKNPYYFVDGQPFIGALPTAYSYLAGDEVTIYFTIAANPEPFFASFDIKGYAKIHIGNAP